jgi:prevent-host-death family protein
MIRQMTATEVKVRILGLLDEVAAGEIIEITKHGRTVARLVPARGPAAMAGVFDGVAVSGDDESLFTMGVDWDMQ